MDGFVVETVDNPEDMFIRVRGKQYHAYFMDTNLGDIARTDISCSRDVYEIVKPKVESGQAYFMSVSDTDKAVEKARDQGIPAGSKLKFDCGLGRKR